MNVLIITQYFPPEIGASASRWGDFSEILIKNEYKVTVLCEAPHYPNKTFFPGYKNSWCHIEKKSENLTIVRSKTFASDRKSFMKKITHYFVFMISAAINYRKIKKQDLIIISSPPLFTGAIGLFLKRVYGVEFWLDVRDLWPDSAFELGQIKKGFLYKMGKILEEKIYNSAKGFIFPVPSFRNYLKDFSQKNSIKPMFELMNGVSQDFIHKHESLISLDQKKFTVLYSGNMGLAQDLKSIVKAAAILKDYEIYFRLIGEGVCREEIENLAKFHSEKIIFHEPLKRDDLIRYIKNSSICLVTLKDKKIFENAIPSKMFEYMACAKPVIVSIRGEAKKIVKDSLSGTVIDPEDSLALSKAILSYFNDQGRCKIEGANGMTYVTKKMSKEVLISDLMKKILK